MGVPGWPELAFCTESMASVRMVLTHSWSSVCWSATVLIADDHTRRSLSPPARRFRMARVSALSSVPVGRLTFDRFEPILPAERYQELMAAVERARTLFEGRAVWNVNSTARGGGVAEMLISLLAYAHGADVNARWEVISGTDPFFALTTRIHNNLHSSPGDGGELGEVERRVYEEALAPNVEEF